MVIPALLLQKPHSKSKAKEHGAHVNRRLKQWMNGDINGLLNEGRTIQEKLGRHKQRSGEHTARISAKLIIEGKVRAAHVFPDKSETARDSLLEILPSARRPVPSVIVNEVPTLSHIQ